MAVSENCGSVSISNVFPDEVAVQPVQEPCPDKNSKMKFPDFGMHDNQTFQTISRCLTEKNH